MTTQTTYTIKEAAKKVKVETHVLRYWEEELGLHIGRNDLGHRFYTEADVELMEHVKQWKDQGLQLKAIRLMLSEDGKLSVPREVVQQAQAMVERAAQSGEGGQLAERTDCENAAEIVPPEQTNLVPGADRPRTGELESIENILLDERSSKAAKLQFLLENLVSRAVQENNQAILKELDYQFRQFEENAQAREQKHWEREEEHYRKLDELICQRGRRKDKEKDTQNSSFKCPSSHFISYV